MEFALRWNKLSTRIGLYNALGSLSCLPQGRDEIKNLKLNPKVKGQSLLGSVCGLRGLLASWKAKAQTLQVRL